MENVCSFFELLYSSTPMGEGYDKLTWKLTQTCVFHVHCYYNLLFGPLTDVFLGSAFGVQRCPNGFLSFYRQQLGVGYIPLII